MIRPLGSLPQSPYRVQSDADTLSGFRALSVGSHHPLVTLDLVSPRGDIPCRASWRPQAAAGSSLYWPPRVMITKTIRATLLASATAVSLNLYLTVLRASSEEAQTRSAS